VFLSLAGDSSGYRNPISSHVLLSPQPYTSHIHPEDVGRNEVTVSTSTEIVWSFLSVTHRTTWQSEGKRSLTATKQ